MGAQREEFGDGFCKGKRWVVDWGRKWVVEFWKTAAFIYTTRLQLVWQKFQGAAWFVCNLRMLPVVISQLLGQEIHHDDITGSFPAALVTRLPCNNTGVCLRSSP